MPPTLQDRDRVTYAALGELSTATWVEAGKTWDVGGVDIDGGTVSLFKSPVTGNTACQGGGIFNNFGTLNLTRSPVVNNTATGGPGLGGGILNGGTVMLKKSPVTGNDPDNCDAC